LRHLFYGEDKIISASKQFGPAGKTQRKLIGFQLIGEIMPTSSGIRALPTFGLKIYL